MFKFHLVLLVIILMFAFPFVVFAQEPETTTTESGDVIVVNGEEPPLDEVPATPDVLGSVLGALVLFAGFGILIATEVEKSRFKGLLETFAEKGTLGWDLGISVIALAAGVAQAVAMQMNFFSYIPFDSFQTLDANLGYILTGAIGAVFSFMGYDFLRYLQNLPKLERR